MIHVFFLIKIPLVLKKKPKSILILPIDTINYYIVLYQIKDCSLYLSFKSLLLKKLSRHLCLFLELFYIFNLLLILKIIRIIFGVAKFTTFNNV